MNYTKLSQRYKRQLLVNSQALWMAIKCLEKITGVSSDEWMAEIAEDANQIISSMSDQEVNAMIAEIEQQANNSGVIHVKQKDS